MASRNVYHTLPPGYRFAYELFGDDDWSWRTLLYANLLALVPLGAAVVFVWLPYQVYAALGAPLARIAHPGWAAWGDWLFGAAVVIGSMLVHETIHALVLGLHGAAPRIGWQFGYLYVTVRAGVYLTRRVYLTMVLAPLVTMTLGGAGVLIVLAPALGQIVLLALLLNAAASIGDLIVARRVVKAPPGALFTDAGGICVFVWTDGA